MLNSTNSTLEPKLCFILGILPRSGTNHIFRLLKGHPDCTGPGPIYENYMVHHSELLKNYTNSVYNSWNPKWKVHEKIGPQETFLRYFGDAISQFLRLQITGDTENQTASNQGFTEEYGSKSNYIVIVKQTPNVQNVQIASPASYTVANLGVGDQYYIDRTYTLLSIPAELAGGEWIKTANDDKKKTSENYLVFNISVDSTVYVAYDVRATSLPNWLANNFVSTGQSITVSDEGNALTVYKRNFSAGTVILGANLTSGAAGAKILLTKTPSVEGVQNFFDLFPDVHLILIVRDGRAVVESGVRSFDWNYEDAMRRWRAGAHAILDLKEKYENSNKKLLIVKYEDLIMDEKSQLLKIFAFLGIEPGLYDFDRAKSLGVSGSSDTRKQTGAVYWNITEKGKDFNPLARFSNWDRKEHERFNWIAGRYMSRLGYDIEAISSNRHLYVIRNRFIDSKWILKKIYLVCLRIVRRIAYGAKKFGLNRR